MSAPLAPLVLGTAGHIDHGKTALVAALTGHETDRLPQEQARGISIELGFAPLELPSGRRVSVVDVPGHERFVRTMVAGATGIDLFLMVVAADDGVMPQTREHAAVLRGLGVRTGVVAITKTDLLDPEPAAEEAAALLPGVPQVAVSVRTGAGLDALPLALDAAAAALPGRASTAPEAPLRLHVDRAFTIRGAGTVVTGTLWAGTVGRGDEVDVLPEGRRARVRGVQVHDEPADRAVAGQRVALNLVGLARDEVPRGALVAAVGSGAPRPSHVVDVELLVAPERRPEHGERLQVHHATREAPARVAALGGPFAQLRLERPLLADRGDRLVLRRLAPPDTLGGAVVLDPAARRHGASRDAVARLERLRRGETAEPPPGPAPPLPTQPEPLSPAAQALGERLRAAGLSPPAGEELDGQARELTALRAAGRAVRVGRIGHLAPEALVELRARVEAHIDREGSITVAGLRDELGTSRRHAQALLEHLDAARVTRRVGDERVLRARARPA